MNLKYQKNKLRQTKLSQTQPKQLKPLIYKNKAWFSIGQQDHRVDQLCVSDSESTYDTSIHHIQHKYYISYEVSELTQMQNPDTFEKLAQQQNQNQQHNKFVSFFDMFNEHQQ